MKSYAMSRKAIFKVAVLGGIMAITGYGAGPDVTLSDNDSLRESKVNALCVSKHAIGVFGSKNTINSKVFGDCVFSYNEMYANEDLHQARMGEIDYLNRRLAAGSAVEIYSSEPNCRTTLINEVGHKFEPLTIEQVELMVKTCEAGEIQGREDNKEYDEYADYLCDSDFATQLDVDTCKREYRSMKEDEENYPLQLQGSLVVPVTLKEYIDMSVEDRQKVTESIFGVSGNESSKQQLPALQVNP